MARRIYMLQMWLYKVWFYRDEKSLLMPEMRISGIINYRDCEICGWQDNRRDDSL
jgi:hypothetical protein